jgi:hypothetical protein
VDDVARDPVIDRLLAPRVSGGGGGIAPRDLPAAILFPGMAGAVRVDVKPRWPVVLAADVRPAGFGLFAGLLGVCAFTQEASKAVRMSDDANTLGDFIGGDLEWTRKVGTSKSELHENLRGLGTLAR